MYLMLWHFLGETTYFKESQEVQAWECQALEGTPLSNPIFPVGETEAWPGQVLLLRSQSRAKRTTLGFPVPGFPSDPYFQGAGGGIALIWLFFPHQTCFIFLSLRLTKLKAKKAHFIFFEPLTPAEKL